MQKHIFVISQAEVVDTVGGAITVFIEFCNMLVANDYAVTGLCYADENSRPQNLDEKVTFQNLRYYKQSPSLCEGLNAYAQEHKPDMFIFFFFDLYAQANLLPQFDAVPRILMYHMRPDIFDLWYNHSPKQSAAYKNTITQVLFPSHKKLLPEYIRNDPVVVIPNGITLPTQHCNPALEHKKIVYLSRLDKYKGVEFLIDSFAVVARSYPDWKLDIYGQPKTEEYIDELQKRVVKRKLDKQIFFKGITLTPQKTLLNYDFCVFPSFMEGFGLGLAEALSVGLPAVGLKGCTGVNELIIDGQNGFLTDFNKKDFANKIITLIEDKNLRRKMSNAAITISQKYEKSKVWQMWLKLIDNIFTGKFDFPPLKNVDAKYLPFDVRQIEIMTKKYEKAKIFGLNVKGKKVLLYLFGIKISFKRKERK